MTYEWKSYIIAPFIAIGGAVIGILGSILRELFHYSYILVFIAAPIIEEALKPTGLYLMLVLWPKMLKGRLHTALLSALAGLTFAIIENILYLKLYFPHHSLDIVLFRYTAGIGIHVICSFILGFGINQKLLASIRGEIPFLQENKKFFFIPMILHSLYNIVVVVFSKRLGLQ